MTHAMVITAVHLDDKGNPVRYRVENSWGSDRGDKGYFVMRDAWFDELSEKTASPLLRRVGAEIAEFLLLDHHANQNIPFPALILLDPHLLPSVIGSFIKS